MSKALVVIKSMGIGDLCILISSIHAISKKIEKRKKIECLFMDKFSSMENESINPVKPNDNINIMLILSIELHQFFKYSMFNLNNF